MIVRLACLALDARAAARNARPRERAQAARWIAGNVLAIRGIAIDLHGHAPAGVGVLGVRAADLTGALAAIATVPALLDAATLPWHWRLTLRALGMPIADQPVAELLADGASVARIGSSGDVQLAVDTEHRVHVEPGRYELVA